MPAGRATAAPATFYWENGMAQQFVGDVFIDRSKHVWTKTWTAGKSHFKCVLCGAITPDDRPIFEPVKYEPLTKQERALAPFRLMP